MAIDVVDGLEAIEIDEKHREVPAETFHSAERLFHILGQDPPVCKTGERIVAGKCPSLSLRIFCSLMSLFECKCIGSENLKSLRELADFIAPPALGNDQAPIASG